MEWKSQGKRPYGRPRKRWVDWVEDGLRMLRIENWKEVVQDNLVAKCFVVVNTLKSVVPQKKKNKKKNNKLQLSLINAFLKKYKNKKKFSR